MQHSGRKCRQGRKCNIKVENAASKWKMQLQDVKCHQARKSYINVYHSVQRKIYNCEDKIQR